jgi:hypothetical protein
MISAAEVRGAVAFFSCFWEVGITLKFTPIKQCKLHLIHSLDPARPYLEPVPFICKNIILYLPSTVDRSAIMVEFENLMTLTAVSP